MKRIGFVFALLLAVTAPTFADSAHEQLSQKQLAVLIANANTPAEHQRIADYYHAQAKSLLAESYKHVWMGADYARNPVKGVRTLSDHCAYLSKDLKAKSEKATELAAQHEQMAKEAEKK